MSIFSLLEQDHIEIREILGNIEVGSEDTREDLLQELKEALIPHSRAEEKTLYQALKTSGQKSVREQVSDGLEEHEEAEELIEDLENLEVSDDAWMSTFEELQEALLSHLDEEESEVFEQARSVLSEESLEELGERFEDLKSQYGFDTYEESAEYQDVDEMEDGDEGEPDESGRYSA